MVFRLLPQIYSHANQCPYRRFKTIDCGVRWTLDRCFSDYEDHTLSLCDCGGNCSSMRSQFYHRPHGVFYGIWQPSIKPIPIYKTTLFLHMSIYTEPNQCSKKYFPDHFFPGPCSEYRSCRADLDPALNGVYFLADSGPSSKSGRWKWMSWAD